MLTLSVRNDGRPLPLTRRAQLPIARGGFRRGAIAESGSLHFRVTCLSLMSDSEDQHCIVRFFKTAERDVAGTTTRNQYFPQTCFDRPTDERVTLEDGNRLLDESKGLQCSNGITFQQKIRHALQIPQRALGVNQPRQVLAFGLIGFFPAIRLRRY